MTTIAGTQPLALRVHIRGVVQGVGFRPHVFRLACAHAVCGWVRNDDDGVHIHVQGSAGAIEAFIRDLSAAPPPASAVVAIDVATAAAGTFESFEIRASASERVPTTRIAADLPICDACLAELFDPANRRYQYPYITCTNCGPRFSIVCALPYDRAQTTMAPWPLCPECAAEYEDPFDRRFHAQPLACPVCGPRVHLVRKGAAPVVGAAGIAETARLLREGGIVAIKGIGGFHVACDADNTSAVAELRNRKFRKDRPFAVMVRDLGLAERTVNLTDASRSLLMSPARPIVLAPALDELPGIAPVNPDIGVMLPYAPLHHLLFAADAPARLVMTSGNRSSEPIAYLDEDALSRLDGLVDAWLVGERPIARRVDDSVVRISPLGPAVLRRSRGLAPGVVASLAGDQPILAVGGDLKNSITLVVAGQACASQHIGDLSHHASFQAFETAIRDFISMYELAPSDLLVAYDSHPQYVSTGHALALGAKQTVAVQHHRAHVASVLAERGEFDRRALGVAFDGTGFGDDGTIWGGEFFVGSICDGFERVAHLRRAVLPGGDAAAQHPVQAAAGFLLEIDAPDLLVPPFAFPDRYRQACAIARSGVRTFPTTSVGRLFDTVAALVGFTVPITFEGQAAMWLEHLASTAVEDVTDCPCRFSQSEIDWRETLEAVIAARMHGVAPARIARAFHRGLARATAEAVRALVEETGVSTVVLSGGVMQNQLFVADLKSGLEAMPLEVWINRDVPANDGGISLGQAALARWSSPRGT